MSMLTKSWYETFIADYLIAKGYMVITDVRYPTVGKDGYRTTTDIDILARLMSKGEEVIIGEVSPYSYKSPEELDALIKKLTEGIRHTVGGEEVGLGCLLRELGIDEKALKRVIYVWSVSRKDEIKEYAKSKGVEVQTFDEVLADFLKILKKSLWAAGWKEAKTYSEGVLMMLLWFHQHAKEYIVDPVKIIKSEEG